MTKIVRTPSRVAGGITAKEKALLDAHTQRWIGNAMSTAPVDPTRLTAAIKSLYAAVGQKEPRVVIAPSPIVTAFAGGFAAAIWWARKNGKSAATDDATRDATRAATRAAMRATDAATYDATRAATDAATDDATRAATDAAMRAAMRAATDAATDDAHQGNPFAAVALRLGAEFNVEPRLMLQCAKRWWMMYQGGNMWSAWTCYLSAFRDVLGLQLPEHEKYRAWEACAVEGGFRIVHDEFCIVSDRPEILRVDAQNRPHCDDGPSHRWRDGWSLYHWHGMRMPANREYVIHSPDLITVSAIEAETNSEIRRVMMERYGYERYMRDCNAVVVDRLPSDHAMTGLRDARLLVKHVPDDEPIVYVDLLNSTPEPDGTTKRYMLRVNPNAYGGDVQRSAHAAVASTWRNADGSLTYKRYQDYAPQAES